MTWNVTRRSFLSTLTTIAGVAAAPAGGGTRVRLGGPIFLKSSDPGELAAEHRRLGYSAAYCPEAKAGDTVRIIAIRDAFQKQNVVIAEVGAWRNMLDSDAAKRKANLEYVVERMALADEVGARCCVDTAGSYHPTVWYGPHKDNLTPKLFDATVENVRHVVDAVKPTRSKFSIEMMGWIQPDGADSYLKLIRAVDRPKGFGVHLDICNIINSPQKFYGSGELIEETFRKLGRWILSCHAKDLAFIPELNVHFQEVIPGRGEVDYSAYLTELSKLPVDAPLMLEHLKTAEEYEEGKRYIQKVAQSAGVRFA